jgi:hypothetical protein
LTRRAGTVRVLPALALVSLAGMLAGCGAGTDRGGFTSSERAAAQTALDTLKNTSVTTIVLHTSAVSGLPSVCSVRLLRTQPITFRLLMGWRGKRPALGVGIDFSWLSMEVGEGGPSENSWRHSFHTARDARTYAAAVRDSRTKPYQNCEILSLGALKVLPVR